jgi:lipopolysaccharide biosynthesis glycosyltransferase
LADSCFFFAADAKYFPYACLAARQVVKVSAPIPGFILQTGAGDDDLEMARRMLGERITIVDVSSMLEGFGANNGRLGLAAYIRIFADLLPAFEPFRHVIYADSDVLFRRSIADLAATDLRAPLLAAHDVPSYFEAAYRHRLPLRPGAPMFNSGVLMFNMPMVRAEGLLERTRQFAVDHAELCIAYDQDAMNVAFEGRWQTMHPAWNAMTNFSGQIPLDKAYARHFSWDKPWTVRPLGVEPEALDIYRGLAADTPWAHYFNAPVPVAKYLVKRLTRKIDGLTGLLTNDEKLKRRARYDARHTAGVFADHAERGLLAVQYPEVAAGFATAKPA